MKMFFLCGSLEPGRDGVGDYTRRLCGMLTRFGHQTQILSLCDFQVSSFTSEIQTVEDTDIQVHRIPVATSNKQRFQWTQEAINNFQPQWISLQYVPYSFNSKGLPFWLPSFLKKIKGSHKWHIMFHELWIGIDRESSFKDKFIGKVQREIAKSVCRKINVRFATTQNKLYQFHLQSQNIDAVILPIFGNIPLTATKNKSNLFTQFVLFGTIHPGACFEDFIEDLVRTKSELSAPLKFVFIGKNGPELQKYISLLDRNLIDYETMGIQSEEVISEVLVNSDFGISTTPYFQTEKSGVYAAYKEHQINTVCVARDWTPVKGHYVVPNIIKYEKNNLNLKPMNVQFFDLSQLTNQFIKSLSVI